MNEEEPLRTWHLREVLLQAMYEPDEEEAWNGMTFDSSSTAEDLADAIIRRLARFGYPVDPPA